MDQFAPLWVTSGSLLVYEGMSGSLLCHFGSTSASILACEDDFGVTSESLFTYGGGFGATLGSLGSRFWHSRAAFGAIWDHFGSTCGIWG